ncbi:hypothetical protein [Frankia sp. AgB32]|uniref:hypothetical protein n=1 Tax=Frankia sp. AgB32 TaxID=631119 RepID=UPI0020102140|nr:hypothetical protein [Frankia sp. AgB32]MCK9897819.1 hypothetical protein [Frankia sp. AgB32]
MHRSIVTLAVRSPESVCQSGKHLRGLDEERVVLGRGASLLCVAHVGFALIGRHEPGLEALLFVLAGAAAGAVEYAGVGQLASRDARRIAFGVLAAIQSVGRIAATVTAGALWTFVSPTAGLLVTGLVTGPLLVAGIGCLAVRPEPAR